MGNIHIRRGTFTWGGEHSHRAGIPKNLAGNNYTCPSEPSGANNDEDSDSESDDEAPNIGQVSWHSGNLVSDGERPAGNSWEF